MSDFLRGMVYVINIDPSNPEDPSDLRKGSQYDVIRIKNTFETLKATVEIWKAEDDKRQLEEIKVFMKKIVDNHEMFTDFQYVVIYFACHGTWNDMAQLSQISCSGESKKKLCPIRKLLLNPLFKIKELDGKLKWLISQTCRGPHLSIIRPTDGIGRDFTNYFLRSYATTEGIVAFRHEGYGSLYVIFLCKVLEELAHAKNLNEIMAEVSVRLKEFTEASMSPIVQIPETSDNFGRRDFSFLCGFIEKVQHKEEENEENKKGGRK